MFYRKISKILEDNFNNINEKILCISGARQIGKSFIIREVSKKKFKNYIEINLADDYNGEKLFKNIKSKEDFYIKLSIIAGNKLGTINNTIVFLDEIQIYPSILTLLKALKNDAKYRYICSGSELGITLNKTTLIPMGSFKEIKMYPMDFEEFLLANGISIDVINNIKYKYINKESLNVELHEKFLSLFKTYLYVGGLPDAVKEYVNTKNIHKIREVQSDTLRYYAMDASKYDKENKLNIERIYNMLSSNIENKVKRITFSDIENKNDARFKRYKNEIDYLISSGITLDVNAISEPKFPLIQSSKKNLIKLFYNDVGLLTNILYKNNINAIFNDEKKINLGAVYETVVAQELKAHGYNLFYYDRKKLGEVDFLVDDYDNLSILPIEVKSGVDYNVFRALPKLVNNNSYNIKKGIVLSNNKDVYENDNILYLPIYYVMFL